jgi:hypothetical protein
VFLSQNAIFNSTLVRTNGVPAGATIDQLSALRLDTVSGFKTEAQPWYSDQVLPFDITLAGTNENGAATCMKIFGVEILNEGSGVSIDDAVTEMQATFVARYVEPWLSDLVVRGGKKNPSRAGEGRPGPMALTGHREADSAPASG